MQCFLRRFNWTNVFSANFAILCLPMQRIYWNMKWHMIWVSDMSAIPVGLPAEHWKSSWIIDNMNATSKSLKNKWKSAARHALHAAIVNQLLKRWHNYMNTGMIFFVFLDKFDFKSLFVLSLCWIGTRRNIIPDCSIMHLNKKNISAKNVVKSLELIGKHLNCISNLIMLKKTR